MPRLDFSGNLPNTIRNNIIKLPVIPVGAFPIIQDGVKNGRQNVKTATSRFVKINNICDYVVMCVKGFGARQYRATMKI